MIKNIINLITWIFTIFGVLGARETSKPNCNLFKTNCLYSIANLYNILYFAITFQYPYLILNGIFAVYSMRGVRSHFKFSRSMKNSNFFTYSDPPAVFSSKSFLKRCNIKFKKQENELPLLFDSSDL